MFFWYMYPCYVNDISRNKLERYFFGTLSLIDTSDTSNTAISSDVSKTSTSVTLLWSYVLLLHAFLVKPNTSLISRTSKGQNLFSESICRQNKFCSLATNSCTHIITSCIKLSECRNFFLIIVRLFQIIQDILT